MKYILLGYADVDFHEDLRAELLESGEFVGAEGLADPSHSRTVRKSDGGLVTTDGPFTEDALVSFAIVDCESHDRALEIAARVVDATGDPVEVRPVMDGTGGLEM